VIARTELAIPRRRVVYRAAAARLVDHMHLAVSPVLLGSGEHLLSGLDLPALGYEVAQHGSSAAASHIIIRRKA
jgi:dihydrofolate reductase